MTYFAVLNIIVIIIIRHRLVGDDPSLVSRTCIMTCFTVLNIIVIIIIRHRLVGDEPCPGQLHLYNDLLRRAQYYCHYYH